MDINIKKQEKCVICKNWYDPSNAAIFPKSPKSGWWQYDITEERLCKVKGFDTKANYLCRNYERKEM